ncbi:hypothetical protein [Cognatiluteimonas profundi]|uniref:hypothetical protein n=1 Tax=Cognatiluteimonas profundi TaxID=2594501 RepID=UPI00131E1CBC|nr:hypothetical protein [Lysobacter profundi]
MGRRNLANRSDIPADVLRQRRDLYSLAIGLLLFNLARGGFVDQAAVGSVFSVHLGRPIYILAAAWVGFFYFWMRFWLISEEGPYDSYLYDVKWQAGDSKAIRRIAASFVEVTPAEQAHEFRHKIQSPTGNVPRVYWEGVKPYLSLKSVWPRSIDHGRGGAGGFDAGPNRIPIPSAERWAFWRAWVLAFPRAAYRERAFTDYTLPHLVAVATVAVAIHRLLCTR